MKDEELKAYYAKFNDEQYIEELNDFLQARQQYLKNNSRWYNLPVKRK